MSITRKAPVYATYDDFVDASMPRWLTITSVILGALCVFTLYRMCSSYRWYALFEPVPALLFGLFGGVAGEVLLHEALHAIAASLWGIRWRAAIAKAHNPYLGWTEYAPAIVPTRPPNPVRNVRIMAIAPQLITIVAPVVTLLAWQHGQLMWGLFFAVMTTGNIIGSIHDYKLLWYLSRYSATTPITIEPPEIAWPK